MRDEFKLVVCGAALALIFGCSSTHVAQQQEWSLEHVSSVTGFRTPECAEVHPVDGTVFVSNIYAVERDAVGALDANGFISLLEPGGKVKELCFIKGTKELPIHGPSGMCFLEDWHYFNDRGTIKRRPLDGSGPVELVPMPIDKGFNDAASDGKYVYVSAPDAIYRVDVKGNGSRFMDLKGVNGIKSWKGRLFAVTTDGDKSDIYELDPKGRKAPKPFGLAPQFAGLDGIELLPDGTFLITDCLGHKVYTIAPDRKTVKLVAEGLEYPADLGVDIERGYVYVPQFFRNTVEVYRLTLRSLR